MSEFTLSLFYHRGGTAVILVYPVNLIKMSKAAICFEPVKIQIADW